MLFFSHRNCWLHGAAAALLLAIPFTAASAIRTDRVLGDGFEARPIELSHIEFAGDQTALFTAAGQSAQLSARVIGEDGQIVPGAVVEWTSSAPSTVSVQSTGALTATVTAQAGQWEEPVSIVVRHLASGLQAQAHAVHAQTATATVVIPSEKVLSILGNRSSEHELVLTRDTQTDTIGPGSIVVSGDHAGVLVQVLSKQIAPDRLLFRVNPAPVTAAFERVHFLARGETLKMVSDARSSAATGAGTVLAERDPTVAGNIFEDSLLQFVRCDGGIEGQTDLDLRVLALRWSLQPEAELKIENSAVTRFRVGLVGHVEMEAAVAMTLDTALNVSGVCEAELPDIRLPAMSVGFLSIAPIAVPRIGVELDLQAEASVGHTLIEGIRRRADVTAGVAYSPASGWTDLSSFTLGGEMPVTSGTSFAGEANVEVGAFAALDANLGFTLGSPVLGFELARVKFLEIRKGLYWQFGIHDPVSPQSPTYAGPWTRVVTRESADLALSASLFQGPLSDFLGIDLDSGIEVGLYEVEETLVSAPSVYPHLECAGSCANIEPGGTVTLSVTAFTPSSGTVEFWALENGEDVLKKLASGSFGSGRGGATFVVPQSDVDKHYLAFARLKLDDPRFAITQMLPLNQVWTAGGFSTSEDSTTDCDHNSEFIADMIDCVPDPVLRACVARYADIWTFRAYVPNFICDAGVADAPIVRDLTGIETFWAANTFLIRGIVRNPYPLTVLPHAQDIFVGVLPGERDAIPAEELGYCDHWAGAANYLPSLEDVPVTECRCDCSCGAAVVGGLVQSGDGSYQSACNIQGSDPWRRCEAACN